MMKVKIAIVGMFLLIMPITFLFAQAPVVLDVGTGKHEFVLVTKANEKFNKPERVVQTNFHVTDEAFDPYKIESYPRWKFSNVDVTENDGKIVRHVTVYNIDTDKYFTRTHGMVPAADWDRAWEKDETGKFKEKDNQVRMRFLFYPKNIEGNFMWLGIPNNEGKSLAVTQMSWNTRSFKLVLVK